MKVTVLFYSNLGGQSGKGYETLYVARALEGKNYLEKVIVLNQNAEMPPYKVVASPCVRRVCTTLGRIEYRLVNKFPSRYWSEVVFDHFASLHLSDSTDILYSVPRMVKSMQEAKKRGKINILIGNELHPLWNERLFEEESQHWNVDIRNPVWSEGMFERYEKSIELSDYILVRSEFAKRNYIEQGVPEGKLYVNPSGVDSKWFKPKETPQDKGTFTFLYVGTLSLLKGVQYLLEAWDSLRLPKARLLIGGHIGLDFQQILRKFGKSKNVEFLGPIDPLPYYQQANVFVFPSLSEGMARVNLEAMACGLPVITTPNSGAVIRDGKDGFFVPPRDVGALKEKMLYFFEQPKIAQEMGQNARQRVLLFSWEDYGKRTVQILEQIVGS